MRHLADTWLATLRRVDAHGDVAGAGADLLARYAEPQRHYHDLTHLDEVLRHVDELAGEASTPDVVRLAAFFHDAVYDPTAADNEEASARLAQHVLAELRVDDTVATAVARLVRVTATHEVEDGDRDAAVLCDADLAVLASGDARYAEYVAAVRAEYAHASDQDFMLGRTRILEALLDQPQLFRTRDGHEQWEARARAAVAAELEQLGR